MPTFVYGLLGSAVATLKGAAPVGDLVERMEALNDSFRLAFTGVSDWSAACRIYSRDTPKLPRGKSARKRRYYLNRRRT